MRILLANKYFYPRGGDCVHTMQLKLLLEENGHEVAVFSMASPENVASDWSRYWPSEVKFGGGSKRQLLAAMARPFGVPEVKRKWAQLLDEFRPDVVHLHNIHSQLSPIIATEAARRKIPVFWTLHDYKLLCPASACRTEKEPVCEECIASPRSVIRKRCIKGSLAASLLGYLEGKRWPLNQLCRATTSFIAPSQFMKRKMVQAGTAPEKVAHLYNFVDDAKFPAAVASAGERRTEAVYVGRLSPEKGCATLCEAFTNTPGTSLRVIGDGPLRAELESRYASERIRFTGHLPWAQIKEILGTAAFMVLPSEWYENNPLTIIESFALGTPVLGADIGGIPELIIPNENGMIFQSGNSASLRTALVAMQAKRDWDYAEISRDAAAKFSATNYYRELMQLYRREGEERRRSEG